MKHPSRWPWIIRGPLCVFLILIVWWGPGVLMFMAIRKFRDFLDSGTAALLAIAVLWAWSWFVMKFVVHTRIEPFFNIRSLQNRNEHLFTPEPVNSWRDWVRLVFRGR
jgi:hypothetical protein